MWTCMYGSYIHFRAPLSAKTTEELSCQPRLAVAVASLATGPAADLLTKAHGPVLQLFPKRWRAEVWNWAGKKVGLRNGQKRFIQTGTPFFTRAALKHDSRLKIARRRMARERSGARSACITMKPWSKLWDQERKWKKGDKGIGWK